jgi:glucose uptake protein
MADVLLGVLYALIAAAGWGSYLVPMKKSGNPDPFRFVFFLSVGVLVFGTLTSLTAGFALSFSNIGIATGMVWTVASISSMFAIRKLGLGKAAATWMSISVLVSFLCGILLLSEQLNLLIIGVTGIILMISGVACVSLSRDGDSKKSGFALTLVSGLIFGVHLVPMRMAGITPSEMLFPMSLGIFFGSSMALAARMAYGKYERMKFENGGLFSGIIWSVANFFSLMAIANVGLSIGFPLSQMSLLVATIWGVFYFREAKGKSQKIRILAGALLMLFGVFALAFSK